MIINIKFCTCIKVQYALSQNPGPRDFVLSYHLFLNLVASKVTCSFYNWINNVQIGLIRIHPHGGVNLDLPRKPN